MPRALLFAAITAVATAAGGVAALRVKDRLHLILGLSGGLLLGLVGFDLLPTDFADQRQVGGVALPAILIVAGFLILHIVERFFATHGEHNDHGHGDDHGHDHGHLTGTITAVAMGGHVFLDGVGLGAAFRVSTSLGIAVFAALVVHAFNDGLNTVGFLIRNGHWSTRARLLVGVDAVFRLSGAAVGSYFLINAHLESSYLSLFTGFVIYIATSHILPEAHARHPSRWTMVMTVLGVLVMWVVVANGA